MNTADASTVADVLRSHPDNWAVIAEGGPVPDPEDLPAAPSHEVLALARRVWEGEDGFTPRGAFDVAIRDNDIYVRHCTKPVEPVSSADYQWGCCFECARPALYLSLPFGTKVCSHCALDLMATEEDPQLARFDGPGDPARV